jgi:hypothetical protein
VLSDLTFPKPVRKIPIIVSLFRAINFDVRSLRQITAAWPIDDYSAAFQIDRRKMEGMAA